MAGYIADGNAYDMIVVGQCASEEDAKTLYANVQTYVSDLKTEAGRYSPEEVARLDGALLRQTGTLVVLCVSDDTAAATAIVEGLSLIHIFNVITGVYAPTNGRVTFNGECIVRNHPTGKMKKTYKLSLIHI